MALQVIGSKVVREIPHGWRVVEKLQPHFAESRLLKDNPRSMDDLAMFAMLHGKRWAQLTFSECDDFITLLNGIDFPISPDEMASHGKFGCDACRETYIEFWTRIMTQPIDRFEESKKFLSE